MAEDLAAGGEHADVAVGCENQYSCPLVSASDGYVRHGIREVSVFGSVARGEDGPGSNVDLAVEIPEDMGLIALAKLELELEEPLGVGVGLVPMCLMKPDGRNSASADLVPL